MTSSSLEISRLIEQSFCSTSCGLQASDPNHQAISHVTPHTLRKSLNPSPTRTLLRLFYSDLKLSSYVILSLISYHLLWQSRLSTPKLVLHFTYLAIADLNQDNIVAGKPV